MGALPPYFPEIRSGSVSSIKFSVAFTYLGLRKMLYEFPDWSAVHNGYLNFFPQLDFQKNIYLNPTFSASD